MHGERTMINDRGREKRTMTRIDVKMMSSKELRELRNMIREELDFRADVGQEIQENEKHKKVNREKEDENANTEENSERV